MTNQAWLAVIQFERIQSFLFEVPELKTMIGSNALVGEVLRGRLQPSNGKWKFDPLVNVNPLGEYAKTAGELEDNLPALATRCGARFPDPDLLKNLDLPDHETGGIDDPLTDDHDNPAAGYENGILIRDAGNLHAVFPEEDHAKKFLTEAQKIIQTHLPGLRYTIRLDALEKKENGWVKANSTDRLVAAGIGNQQALPDGPQLQVCQASGQGPAHELEELPDKTIRYVSLETNLKREKGQRFDKDGTADILGLMRQGLLARLAQFADGELDFTTQMNELAPSGKAGIIVADGNGIGDRSRKIRLACGSLDEFRQYAAGENFFHRMRRVVRRCLVTALVQTFGSVVEQGRSFKKCPFRLLMLGGDDLLLACDASFALPFLIHYANQLKQHDLEPSQPERKPLNIGAGVAIVKRDFPFHRAHQLAEELAKSAKRLARQDPALGSTVDWLSCTESWHGDVADVRRRDALRSYKLDAIQIEHLILSSKPYPILQSTARPHSLETLWNAAAPSESGTKELARTQLKQLATVLPQGKRLAEQAVQNMPAAARETLIQRSIFHEAKPFATPWHAHAEGRYSTVFLDFLELFELQRALLPENHVALAD